MVAKWFFLTTVYGYFRLLLVVPKVLTSVLGKVTFKSNALQ